MKFERLIFRVERSRGLLSEFCGTAIHLISIYIYSPETDYHGPRVLRRLFDKKFIQKSGVLLAILEMYGGYRGVVIEEHQKTKIHIKIEF